MNSQTTKLAFPVLLLGLLLALAACDRDRPGRVSMPVDGGGGGGGGAASSGLDGSRQLTSLNAAELTQLCGWASARAGGAGSTTTCDGLEITIQSGSECEGSLADATCAITVGVIETCWNAVAVDACVLLSDPNCAQVVQCAVASEG